MGHDCLCATKYTEVVWWCVCMPILCILNVHAFHTEKLFTEMETPAAVMSTLDIKRQNLGKKRKAKSLKDAVKPYVN